MFGSMFLIKKHYVVIGQFNNSNWYLADVQKVVDTIIREWTSNADVAIQFDKKSDAEIVALMVCEDTSFKIGGISKIKQ